MLATAPTPARIAGFITRARRYVCRNPECVHAIRRRDGITTVIRTGIDSMFRIECSICAEIIR